MDEEVLYLLSSEPSYDTLNGLPFFRLKRALRGMGIPRVQGSRQSRNGVDVKKR